MSWPDLLVEYDRAASEYHAVHPLLPPMAIAAGTCALPGASEEAIAAQEARIGSSLPPSYRTFLRASNGLRQFGLFVPELWPVEKIGWYRDLYPRFLAHELELASEYPNDVPDEIYFDYSRSSGYRSEHLSHCLVIGLGIDHEFVLLNSAAVDATGDWEAWFLASWIPGANRFANFRTMFEAEIAKLDQFRKLRTQSRR